MTRPLSTADSGTHQECGRELLHYRLLRRLGAGGMGVTYEALDTRLGRSVAVKTLLPELATDPVRRRLLVNEARAAAALRHPNICTIHTIEEAQGELFIVMEYIEGRPLAELIGDGPLAPEHIVRIGLQLTDALDYAHRHGVVHRDIKPANIILTEGERAKVLDFGLAKRLPLEPAEDALSRLTTLAETLTSAGALVGTLCYMSPEQLRGEEVDGRSDLFALGVVLYELCTGRHPFQRPTAMATAAAILSSEAEPMSALVEHTPVGLERIVLGCLCKERDRRYGSSAEVMADLRRHLDARLPLHGNRAARPSIAVVPFAAIGGDAPEDYFSEGISGEIVQRLARMRELRVLSRTATARFKGRQLDACEVGRELGVSAVLAGGIQRMGERCRLSAELVDVEAGFDLWADSYDVSLTDIFDVQERVATQIAEALRLRLREEGPAAGAPAPTESMEAFEAYLQGRHAYFKFTESDNRLAMRLLRRALDRDGSFAKAHAALASAHVARVERGWARDPGRRVEAALACCETAIRLDPDLSEAYSARGLIHFMHKRLREAEADVRQALALDASNDVAHDLLGRVFFVQGELERAEVAYREALEISPFYIWCLDDLAWAQWLLHRVDEARSTLQRVLELSPGDEAAHTGLAALHYFDGELDAALVECEQAWRVNPQYPFLVEILPVCLARRGDYDRARRICSEALERDPRDMLAHAALALVGARQGRPDEARRDAEAALALQTFYTPANLNLAIQFSFEGHDDWARRWLEKGLREGLGNRAVLRRHPVLRRLLLGLGPAPNEGGQDG